jgi:uncharacterized membrane protein
MHQGAAHVVAPPRAIRNGIRLQAIEADELIKQPAAHAVGWPAAHELLQDELTLLDRLDREISRDLRATRTEATDDRRRVLAPLAANGVDRPIPLRNRTTPDSIDDLCRSDLAAPDFPNNRVARDRDGLAFQGLG